MKTLALSTLSALLCATSAFAGDIAIYVSKSSGSSRDHDSPTTAGALPSIYKYSYTDTSYTVRDLTTLNEAKIQYQVLGKSRYYYVYLNTEGDYNSVQSAPYNPNYGYSLFKTPKSTSLTQYEFYGFGDFNPAPADLYYSSHGYIAGLQKSVKLKASLKTLLVAPSLAGTFYDLSYGPYQFTDEDEIVVEEGNYISYGSGKNSMTLSSGLTDLANKSDTITVGSINYVGGTVGRGVYEVIKVLEKAKYVLDDGYGYGSGY